MKQRKVERIPGRNQSDTQMLKKSDYSEEEALEIRARMLWSIPQSQRKDIKLIFEELTYHWYVGWESIHVQEY